MSRATRFATFATLGATLYFFIWFSILPMPLLDDQVKDEIMPVIPWWLLVSFGSYSLYSLGKGLYTFNDVPEAYEELMKEIAAAKNDLRAKGVSVD